MISNHIKLAIDRYVEYHIPVGHFLTAVLENDLASAIFRADEENLIALRDIVRYCWNEIPGDSWCSPDNVKRWLAGD